MAPDLSLTVTVGLNEDQFPVLCSGGELTSEPVRYQFLQNPDWYGKELVLSGENTVAVYAGFFEFCSPPVAIGTGSYTYTSIGTNGAAGNTLVFRGRATDQAGQVHQILTRLHLQVTGTGEQQVFMDDFSYR